MACGLWNCFVVKREPLTFNPNHPYMSKYTIMFVIFKIPNNILKVYLSY